MGKKKKADKGKKPQKKAAPKNLNTIPVFKPEEGNRVVSLAEVADAKSFIRGINGLPGWDTVLEWAVPRIAKKVKFGGQFSENNIFSIFKNDAPVIHLLLVAPEGTSFYSSKANLWYRFRLIQVHADRRTSVAVDEFIWNLSEFGGFSPSQARKLGKSIGITSRKAVTELVVSLASLLDLSLIYGPKSKVPGCIASPDNAAIAFAKALQPKQKRVKPELGKDYHTSTQSFLNFLKMYNNEPKVFLPDFDSKEVEEVQVELTDENPIAEEIPSPDPTPEVADEKQVHLSAGIENWPIEWTQPEPKAPEGTLTFEVKQPKGQKSRVLAPMLQYIGKDSKYEFGTPITLSKSSKLTRKQLEECIENSVLFINTHDKLVSEAIDRINAALDSNSEISERFSFWVTVVEGISPEDFEESLEMRTVVNTLRALGIPAMFSVPTDPKKRPTLLIGNRFENAKISSINLQLASANEKTSD
jgi:hypothetical protein